MDISTHFLIGLIVSIILYPFYGIASLIFLAASFLIDIDHYLISLFHGEINIKKSYLYFRKSRENNRFEKLKNSIFIFHTVEFIALLAILAFLAYSPLWLAVFAIVLHDLLDMFYEKAKLGVVVKKPSLVWVLLARRK